MIELAYLRVVNVEIRITTRDGKYFVQDRSKTNDEFKTVQEFDDERAARNFFVGCVFGFTKYLKFDRKIETDYMGCEDCGAMIVRW
jgi:hypothetical protein